MMFPGGERMNSLMRSLDRRFAFGHAENAPEEEENVKESPLDASAKTVEDEEISVSELRRKVHEAEANVAAYHDKAVQANERATLFQDQVVETTKRAASLKSELEANLVERVSLEKTIHDLKIQLQETEKKNVCQQDRTAEANERAKLYQHQALEASKQIASLKADLEAKPLTYTSLEKTIDELKQQISEKETLATSYKEKLVNATDNIVLYQNQAIDATKRTALLKSELEASSSSRLSLEKTVEELQTKVQEAEKKVEEKTSEYGITKDKFELKEELEAQKAKVAELQQMVESIKVEREGLAQQLALHTNSIRDQQSREFDAYLEDACHSRETEVKLLEATQKIKLRDYQVTDLKDKLYSLESQVSEATNSAQARQIQLDEASQEIKKLEGIRLQLQGKIGHSDVEKDGLVGTNMKLSHDLTHYEAKLNDMQETLEAVLADKEETIRELDCSRKTVEDLRQQISAGWNLHSQISSVVGENHLISEMHRTTNKDIQAVISQLEEQLNKQKAKESTLNGHLDSLKADLMVKLELQAKVAELEQQLSVMDKQFKAEKEDLSKKLQREASLERQQSEKEAKTQYVQSLEKEIEDLKKKLVAQEENTKKWETSMEPPLGKNHVEHDHVKILEEKIEELENKLQIAEADNRSMQQYVEGRVEREHVEILEEKVVELEKKLQIAEALNKEKVDGLLEKKVEELEHKLQMTEEKGIEEGNKLAFANIELEVMRNKLSQTTELEMQIAELEREMQSMKNKYSEQDAEGRKRLAFMNLELDGLRNTSNQSFALEKKIAELESELLVAKSGPKSEGVGVEVDSRGFTLGATTPSDVSKTSKDPTLTKATTATQTFTQQHLMGIELKFVIGMVLLSVAIGVLLGKHVAMA